MTRNVTCLILLTGSRKLRDCGIVRVSLRAAVDHWGVDPAEVGVVSGGAGGLDTIGAAEAAAMGMCVAPPMLADWDHCVPDCPPGPTHRQRFPFSPGVTFCPGAGCRRNQAMVDRVVRFLNAAPGRRAVCLAFPMGRSTGTRDCMRRAKAVGVEVRTCTGDQPARTRKTLTPTGDDHARAER